MTLFKLVINSLKHYYKANISIALGIAISTAVITGALIVGDSVKYSLQQAAKYRLGDINNTITAGDRFFTENLALSLSENLESKFSSVLKLDAIAIVSGGKARLNKVQLWGVDENFADVLGTEYPYDSLSGDEVLISRNIADKLNLKVDDHFLLKIKKASIIPLNAPFVSADDQVVARRVSIKAIVEKKDFARINLSNSQTAPYNIFVNSDWLNATMNLKNSANLIISNADIINIEDLKSRITIEDVNLNLNHIDTEIRITSDRIFIDNSLSENILNAFPNAKPKLTYFVNSISIDSLNCPYSFVSTKADLNYNDIIINSWLANDINAKVGDSIVLNYFVVNPLRKLDIAEESFIIKEIYELKNNLLDQKLMPDFPGLSDAGSCSDWETGIPIDLNQIRDKDEDYWDEFKGTPKAFISLEHAKKIWNNRFGTYTSFSIENKELAEVNSNIETEIDPFKLGFQINNVKEQGVFAAQNGTDFSQLFIGLSFFIIVSGLLLTVLLFLFNLDNRASQIGTLTALGFSKSMIRKMFYYETLIVAFFGGLLGVALSVLYNKLVFIGLNRVWQDVVRTSVLEIEIKPSTLIIGFFISIIITWITIALSLNKRLKNQVVQNQKNDSQNNNKWIYRLKLVSFALLTLFALASVVLQLNSNEYLNEVMFFMAGSSLLVAFLLFFDLLFLRISNSKSTNISLAKLSWINMVSNRRRSIMVIVLLSIGAFLVVSTGANRKNLFVNANLKESGTGGFSYYAKTTLPVLKDLSNSQVKQENGIADSINIIQFRSLAGDDASCLNLNRISNPQLLGVKPEELKGRFSFVTKSHELNENNPWLSLDSNMGNIIPAIADQTVIKWSLGKKVGDTLVYQNEMGDSIYLKLIGGLAASVFQGNMLISDKNFLKNYPSSSGSNVFLIDGNSEDIESEFNLAFKDLGWEMNSAPMRLANFKSVENTYLSIFLILGALGLLLGSIGLAVVLARSISERKSELALLLAIGYSKTNIYLLVFREYFNLLILGLIGGIVTAIVSVLPALLKNQSISIGFIAIILGILLLNGVFWIWIVTFSQIRKIKISAALREE